LGTGNTNTHSPPIVLANAAKVLVSPVPTFCCHQKILTVYHSTFLIRLSPHTNSAPRNGGVSDFWRPPSTGRSQWAKEKIPSIKTCLSSQARITQREAASPTVKPIGFYGTSLGRIPLLFFLPPPVLGLYSGCTRAQIKYDIYLCLTKNN